MKTKNSEEIGQRETKLLLLLLLLYYYTFYICCIHCLSLRVCVIDTESSLFRYEMRLANLLAKKKKTCMNKTKCKQNKTMKKERGEKTINLIWNKQVKNLFNKISISQFKNNNAHGFFFCFSNFYFIVRDSFHHVHFTGCCGILPSLLRVHSMLSRHSLCVFYFFFGFWSKWS